MRNAAAHENCLLNSLKAPYNVSNHKTKSVMDMISKISGISDNSRKKWLSNPVIHDFIVTVYLFLNVVKTKDAKQSGISNLDTLFHNRMPANKEYYEKNDTLKECYNFTNRAITYFCNKYRKK